VVVGQGDLVGGDDEIFVQSGVLDAHFGLGSGEDHPEAAPTLVEHIEADHDPVRR
jgi:hypothetical protein